MLVDYYVETLFRENAYCVTATSREKLLISIEFLHSEAIITIRIFGVAYRVYLSCEKRVYLAYFVLFRWFVKILINVCIIFV